MSDTAGAVDRVSYALLKASRAQASQDRKYSSEDTRAKIIKTFRDAFGEKDPYPWQVDVTEALLLGLDSIVIAGTGAGKTMPFIMPLLVDQTKRKFVVIISPLNELEQDQVSVHFICYQLTYL